MTPEQRIIALERDLIETRSAAARMMIALACGLVTTPQGRHEIADAMDEAAQDAANPYEARLARLVASGLRG